MYLSPAVIKRRLRVLIRAMAKRPPHAYRHFDMCSFLGHWGDDRHPVPQSTSEFLHQCGTTACAMGFAATMPYFRKLGLRFKRDGRLNKPDVITGHQNYLWDELFGGSNIDKSPQAWAKRAKKVLKDIDQYL